MINTDGCFCGGQNFQSMNLVFLDLACIKIVLDIYM